MDKLERCIEIKGILKELCTCEDKDTRPIFLEGNCKACIAIKKLAVVAIM